MSLRSSSTQCTFGTALVPKVQSDPLGSEKKKKEKSIYEKKTTLTDQVADRREFKGKNRKGARRGIRDVLKASNFNKQGVEVEKGYLNIPHDFVAQNRVQWNFFSW